MPKRIDGKTTKKPDSEDKSCQCSQEKLSIVSIICRICYDDDKDEPIITPCRCKGTVAFIHRSCLETWLAESNTTSCELCHHVYKTERSPKYTATRSIWRWFRYPQQNFGFHIRGLRSDLLVCTLLTPLAILVTYVCLFSADYYNQQKFSNIPAAKWTSVSLLVMVSIMLVGYYLWVYMVVRYHSKVWYYCWQRDCVVRYLPPSNCDHEAVESGGGGVDFDEASFVTLDGASVTIVDEEQQNDNEDDVEREK